MALENRQIDIQGWRSSIIGQSSVGESNRSERDELLSSKDEKSLIQ